MAAFHIGLSGFSYKEWQGDGRLYPVGLKQKEFFSFYASRYNALEAVGAWYQTPSEASVAGWVEGSPEGFRISPKMHREVTHLKRLKPTGFEAMNSFLKSLEPLEKAKKLGPILIQLPPNLKRDDQLLETFLAVVPKRASLRWAIEFRNDTWHHLDVEQMLNDKGIAWVAADTDESDAHIRDTADQVYVRLRKSEYSDAQLQDWASFLNTKLAEGKDCFVFCRHTDIPTPWLWADRLMELVSSSPS